MCVLVRWPKTGAHFLRLVLVCLPPRYKFNDRAAQYADVSIPALSLLFPRYTSFLVLASGIDVRAFRCRLLDLGIKSDGDKVIVREKAANSSTGKQRMAELGTDVRFVPAARRTTKGRIKFTKD